MPDTLNFERFELKYIIPKSLIEPIVDYIGVYCQQDKYSQSHPEGYYRVNTLYLDSKNFILLGRKKNNMDRRFNLRVRSYGDGTCPPYFFEMKCKRGNIVEKYRSRLDRKDWKQYLVGTPPTPQIKNPFKFADSNGENLENFLKKAESLQVEPKILTQYDRLAYFSTIDDYARVTFDRNLKFQMTNEYLVAPETRKMVNYDLAEVFGTRQSSVVLELKSYKKVPIWMLDLVRYFGLNRSSFSKYEKSYDESESSYLADLQAQVPSFMIG